jgi:competence protein ComFC
VLRAAKEILKGVEELFFPRGCEACRKGLQDDEYLCSECRMTLPRLEAPYCVICSEPFAGEMDNPFSCANCGQRRFSFECAVPACLARGAVRELIHRFKYGREYFLRHPLAEIMNLAFEDKRLSGFRCDEIVPVPLHPSRRRWRQFNQAETLARLVGASRGLKVSDVLIRVRNTDTQTQLDRRARIENLRNAFKIRQDAQMKGRNILLLDDVFTTGSTVEECARQLLKAGASRVRVITVARG